MIGIEVNGEFLDLYPDTKVTLKWRNPIFADDGIIPGSYSLPFNIPGGDESPYNARILHNPEIVEAVNDKFEVEAKLYYDQNVYRVGILSYKQGTPTKYNSNFKFGTATISENFKSKLISEVATKQYNIPTPNLVKKVFVKPSATGSSPYSLSINGELMEGATLQELATAINGADFDTPVTANYASLGNTPVGIAAPFIEIMPSSNANDWNTDFHVDAVNNPTDWYCEPVDVRPYQDGIKAFLEPYFDETTSDQDIVFPFLINHNQYDEYGGVFSKGVKDYPVINPSILISSGVWWYNANSLHYASITDFKTARVKNMSSYQPFVKLRFVLDKISEYFGFTYKGDFYDHPDVQNMVFYNTTTLDIKKSFITNKEFILPKNNFNTADHLPEMKVVDLFKELQKTLNLAVYFDNGGKTLVLKFRDPIMRNKTSIDFTKLVSPLQSFEDKRVSGVKLKAEVDEEDKYSDTNQYLTGESDDYPIISKVSGLSKMGYAYISGVVTLGTGGIGHSGESCYGPIVKQEEGAEFTPRLFFYSGIKSNGSINYPSADMVGQSFDMRFENLAETLWSQYLRFLLSRKEYRYKGKMEFRDINMLDFESKIEVDGVKYLVNDLTVTLTMQKIQVSKMGLITS